MDTLRIALFDAEPDLVEMLGHALDDAGYRVTALRGRSTEDVAHARPNVVIVDAPPIGREATTRFVLGLRCDPRTAALPLILTTTWAGDVDPVLRSARGVELLAKPFDVAALLDAVARSARATPPRIPSA